MSGTKGWMKKMQVEEEEEKKKIDDMSTGFTVVSIMGGSKKLRFLNEQN